MVDAYQLFKCLGRRIPNERSRFLFLQQQIPCFALLPDSTVKMVFALIKASCVTVKTTARTTVTKKAAKALKVGMGGFILFCNITPTQHRTGSAENRILLACSVLASTADSEREMCRECARAYIAFSVLRRVVSFSG